MDLFGALLVGGLVAGLVVVTIYAAYRALRNGRRGWGAGILASWLVGIGWLVGLMYLLIVDRRSSMTGGAATSGGSVPSAASGGGGHGDEPTESLGQEVVSPSRSKARTAIGSIVLVLGACVLGAAMLLELGRGLAESSIDLTYILLQATLLSLGAAGIFGGYRILWRRPS